MSIALRIDVAIDVVGVHNGMQAVKLLNHLVDAAQEQCQLNVVDQQQRQLVSKQPRVLTTGIDGMSMAQCAIHGDGIVLIHCHTVVVDNLVPLGH